MVTKRHLSNNQTQKMPAYCIGLMINQVSSFNKLTRIQWKNSDGADRLPCSPQIIHNVIKGVAKQPEIT